MRAYVYVTPNQIKNLGTTEAPEGGVTASMIGQTPAYDVQLFTSIATLPYPLTDDIEKYTAKPTDKVVHSVLFPGLKFGSSVRLTYVPTGEQTKIIMAATTARVFVWGKVIYKDTFDCSRYMLFCFNYGSTSFAANGTAEICDQHVEADQNQDCK